MGKHVFFFWRMSRGMAGLLDLRDDVRIRSVRIGSTVYMVGVHPKR